VRTPSHVRQTSRRKVFGARSPRWLNATVPVLSMVLQRRWRTGGSRSTPAAGCGSNPGIRTERPHASTAQVHAIAARMRRPINALLVVTAAYTGMRWGELSGLCRDNVDLTTASIHVHPQVGALHEVDGTLFLGPPKVPTPAASATASAGCVVSTATSPTPAPQAHPSPATPVGGHRTTGPDRGRPFGRPGPRRRLTTRRTC
jgi:hypothetical protein